MYPCLIMAKKASPATSALGVRLSAKCSETEDLPAPGGPVTTTSSPIAALSLIVVMARGHGPAERWERMVPECDAHWQGKLFLLSAALLVFGLTLFLNPLQLVYLCLQSLQFQPFGLGRIR